MRQKPNGTFGRLLWRCQVLEVVAICDHIGLFILRELKQGGAGDHGSQNMCEKSSRKHILKLV
jgi:hypothetical protein